MSIRVRALSQNSRFSAKTADSLVRHARTGTGKWRSGGLPARSISTRFQALTYVVRQSPPHVKFRLADQVTWRCSARQSVHCEAAPREKESIWREWRSFQVLTGVMVMNASTPANQALSQNSRFLGEDGGQFGPPRSDRHRQVAEWRTPCSINLNSLSGIDLCREAESATCEV